MRAVTPSSAPEPIGGYSHAIAVEGELLFISGQTPEGRDSSVAADPTAQLRQVWANVQAVLHAANAGLEDLVHVRTFLSSRTHREINSQVRQQVLGAHAPALTVVICELYDPTWIVEIEAVARVPRSA
jgi:enamine deaminase RidA (YjgF/YER057c/UK114 family)